MSAAISNQWWAAKGLLTEQAKDVRKKERTYRNPDMQKHIYSYKHAGLNRMEVSSRRREAVESRKGGGGSCCLHLSTQQGLDPAIGVF